MDPHAENYYSQSPYSYAANNPIKFIDPNGEDVYMYFYVTGESPKDDEMFWKAALTRAIDMINNGTIGEGDAYVFRSISDIGQIEDMVSDVISQYSPVFGETAEFGLWSHGGFDGPRGSNQTSGEFAMGSQMSLRGWGNIDFNWKEEGGRAMFFSCNSASNKRGTPWAQSISSSANMNNVEVYGETKSHGHQRTPTWGVRLVVCGTEYTHIRLTW